jgi:virginiamycin B lyase
MHRRLLTTLALLASVLVAAGPARATTRDAPCRAHCVTAFPLAAGAFPFGITRGPLASMWFASNDAIARIDRHGQITTYPVPSPQPMLTWVLAEHRDVWFAEFDKIGRITTRGAITEYPLPTRNGVGHGIVRAPDGNLYVTEFDANAIARLDPRTGATHEFPVPTPQSTPLGITVGADGALWFIERAADKVGRMTLDGHFTEYPLAVGAFPNRIVTGPDGAVWFTELRAGKLGRITPDGALSEYPVEGGPVGITVGKDCQLYMALFTSGGVARAALDGTVTGEWDLPGAVGVLQIAPGFGRDIWITDTFGDQLFRLTPHARHHGRPAAIARAGLRPGRDRC